jgi:excisionase family DNA binding protein
MDTHMTLADAARELGLDPSTLRYRLKRGDMRGEKVGPRTWLIPRDEIERWRHIGRQKPGRKPRRPEEG